MIAKLSVRGSAGEHRRTNNRKPAQTPKDRLTSTGGIWYNQMHIPARTLKIKQH